jgi:putative membrane protein
MSKLIIRWFINALGLYLAIGTDWISGIDAEDTSIVAILALAFVFGVINVFVRPLLKLLTCPVILLTLGLFTLVINAVLFWLTGLIGSLFNIGYTVDGFLPALLGGLVVGVANLVLTVLFREELAISHSEQSPNSMSF